MGYVAEVPRRHLRTPLTLILSAAQQQPNQSQPPNPPYQNPQSQGKPPKQDKVSGLLGKLQGTVADFGGDFAQRIGTALDPQAYAEYGQQNPDTDYRFGSFAPARQGNDVKWYVDGCSYFYAVSKALESARESIWILDCGFLSIARLADIRSMLTTIRVAFP